MLQLFIASFGLETTCRVHCLNVLFDKLTGLCYGTLYFQAWCGGVFVMELLQCIMWWCVMAIGKSHVLYVGSVCLAWRALGGIKCCVRFSVPRSLVETLSPVWSSGKGVLFACVKQWSRIGSSVVPSRLCEAVGRGKMFVLISARCEYSARCAMHRRFYS